MTRILVKSVYDAFEYVMERFYPFGLEDYASKETYAVISIQDTHTKGFGVKFAESIFCQDVLTLYFDDIVREVEGAVLFQKEQAEAILAFLDKNRDADEILIHCYAGLSRSRAVGVFAGMYLDCDVVCSDPGLTMNDYVFDLLRQVQKEKGSLKQ